ncbi:cysteine and tyrosine-rich protein 1-like [Haliotis rubra]|uniref:cysteine and tyrosine-rich protein 1-like n=1 Tax=Haliotis rubra TaxID=36100 RepID=UPI001EE52240|nr:cysteine and tyrosine-rich protein 1-like [Haliotis rubra]
MENVLPVVTLFSVIIQACHAADYCYGSYCSGYCCGTLNTSCCNYYTWGSVVGYSIGGLIGFIVFVIIIIFLIKICTKTGTRGRVVNPQPQANVIVVSGM